jgi:uncharacterized lipoprotein
MKALIGLVLLCLLAACSHQARKVDCDKRLTAINPPTPVVKPTATPAVSTTLSAPASGAKPETP